MMRSLFIVLFSLLGSTLAQADTYVLPTDCAPYGDRAPIVVPHSTGGTSVHLTNDTRWCNSSRLGDNPIFSRSTESLSGGEAISAETTTETSTESPAD